MSSDSPQDQNSADSASRHDTLHILQGIQSDELTSESAWIELMSRSESMLRVLARYRLRRYSLQDVDIDDLMQEVWIVACAKINDFQYRGKGSVQRWLAQILHFAMLESGQAKRRNPMVASQLNADLDPETALLQNAIIRTQTAASKTARNREREDAICEALDRLQPEDREVILLRVYEGQSAEEAADSLDLLPNTLSKRFQRALDRLRPLLPKAV